MPETKWTRVESLFHEALPLSPDQREKFLVEACQGDSALYAEIASLLSSYRLEDELLEKMGVPPLASELENAAPMFAPGERLGGYEIIRLLGKGGMGEVYLARDLKLGRKVALKILPRGVAGRPLLIERLRREAQAASALNHPNILTIYDFGQQGDVQYMVSEFVEGVSLREYIGKLSTAEALNYARQIAEALKAAHAAGIIHRDIKPENIMVRSDGYIKVLDFGLAKLAEPQADSGQSLYQRLADSSASTVPGLLVGTINYMSPEQVRGHAADQRTDVWGWGVVFYEMLAGRRPFEASTPGDTLAAILNREPVSPGNFGKINRIVTKSLAKSADERYQTMDEALEDLARVRAVARPEKFKTLALLVVPVWLKKLWLLAAALLVVVAGRWGYKVLNIANQGESLTGNAPVLIESITPLTTSDNARLAAISPDEQSVAYTTRESDGRQALWIRQSGANAGAIKLKTETGQFTGITFSPDGQSLYYVLKQDKIGKLYQLRLPDGLPKMVRDDLDSPINFSPDGTRYAFLRKAAGKSQIIVAGVELSPETIVWPSAAPDYAGDPIWSPDGCCLLFSVLYNSSPEPTNIRLVSVNVHSREFHETQRQPWYYVGRPVWFKNGRVLISATKNNSNWARLWQVSWPYGKISPVLPNTFADLDSGKHQHKVATVEWVRRSTPWVVSLRPPYIQHSVPDLQGTFYGVAWTKSGHLISQSDIGGQPDLWSLEPVNGKAQPITHDESVEQDAVASPDGRYLVYASNLQGTFQLWRSNPDGSSPVRLTTDTSREEQPAIAPDGKSIIYTSSRSGTYGLWKVSIQGGEPVQVTNKAARRAAVSPNGAFILCESYIEQDSGGWQTTVLDAAGNPVRYFPSIRTDERTHAIWSADGKSILYTVTQDGVSNVWEQPFHGGSPKQLTHFTNERIFSFALSFDGRSLACVRGTERWNAVLLRIAQ